MGEVICRDCMCAVGPNNGNFDLELCFECNLSLLKEEGITVFLNKIYVPYKGRTA